MPRSPSRSGCLRCRLDQIGALDSVEAATSDHVIVVISKDVISDVLDAAATIAAHEAQIAHQIEHGTTITEAMGRNYEQMLHDDRPTASNCSHEVDTES